ncbi:uncharacterized protein LOC107829493 [Nicotiana tabacum]|uniref:Uncharacterized protein LOC107829493 n=1 Tax=Nicotiana tabacum TaxID=4097 RepID=A0AC58UH25_TOBAC
MADSTPLNRVPRGLSASAVDERRTKLHNGKLKEVEVDKSSKETKNPVGSKRKKTMKDSQIQKGINSFVKHQPKLAPHISAYTNTDIVSQLKDKLIPVQYQQFGNTCFGSFLQMKRCDVQHQLFRCFMALQLDGAPNNVFAVHVNSTELHFTLREFAACDWPQMCM